MNLFMYWFKCR